MKLDIKKGGLFLEINNGFVKNIYNTPIDKLKVANIIVTVPTVRRGGKDVVVNKSVMVEFVGDIRERDVISGIADYVVKKGKDGKFYVTYKLIDWRLVYRPKRLASERRFNVIVQGISKTGSLLIDGEWFNFTPKTKGTKNVRKGQKVNIYYIRGKKKGVNFLNAVYVVGE